MPACVRCRHRVCAGTKLFECSTLGFGMTKKKENLLDMVPVQLREARTCGDGTVDVLIPRFGDSWVGAILGRVFKNKPIHLHLDEVGTAVWNLCDGRRTVHDIGKSLETEFGDRIDPVYERLGLFFHQMKKAGIVEWRR